MAYFTRPGLASAGAYQVSGTPFLTGATIPSGTQFLTIEFPGVTKAITVFSKNANRIWPTSSLSGTTELLVFFGKVPTVAYPYPQITNNHYVTLRQEEDKYTFNVKCTQIHIAKFNKDAVGAFEIVAEITSIDKFDMFIDGVREAILSGSGVDY